MKVVDWKKDELIERDVSDVQNYALDWSSWLGDLTLSSVAVSANSDLVATVVSTGDTDAVIRVSGGAAGTTGGVTVTATASDGQVQQRTVLFRTKEL